MRVIAQEPRDLSACPNGNGAHKPLKDGSAKASVRLGLASVGWKARLTQT